MLHHPLLKNKRVYLFDFDGTLVDSMPMWEDIDRRYLARYDIPVPEGLSERLIPLSEDATAAVFLELGCPGTVASIRAEHDRMAQEEYEHTIPLKEGARELLDHLRASGATIGIISASTLTRMLPCIARLGLSGYFNLILPCGEYDMHKNTAKPYELALQTLGVHAEDAVFIDDFQGNIAGAKLASLTTVGVYDSVGAASWEAMQKTADLCVTSLTELMK